MQQSTCRSFFVSGDVSLPQEHYHIMSISVCSGQCFIFLCFSYLTYSGVTYTCSGNIHVSVPLYRYMYIAFHGNIIRSQLYLIDLIFLSFSPFVHYGFVWPKYSIFSVFCGFCQLDACMSLLYWLTIDGGCHMTVFEICVKVSYMYTWGLNFHPFIGYPEATNQHPQVI